MRRIFGRAAEPVVVTFLSGRPELALRMLAEVRALVPQYRHLAVGIPPLPAVEGVEVMSLADAPLRLRGLKIGLAPVLLTGETEFRRLRWAALRWAPHKLLAYNSRLERHHLRLSTCIASYLFVRGVPLDRIWLRPRWLMPWAGEASSQPSTSQIHDGRPLDHSRPRVAVLSPYFPYPLTHGGAVRIFNLLREASRHFDIFLFAFGPGEPAALTEICARVYQLPMPRYREPRWSTLLPPEVHEFHAPALAELIAQVRREFDIRLMQVEYTQLAPYRGDVLVEHDITFDLYRQIHDRERRLASWWNWWRWKSFEVDAASRYRAVVTMSEKDQGQLSSARTHVIPNGVDLSRFTPQPEPPAARVLFVGSFRHFPNVVAYRFLVDEIWPELRRLMPAAELVVVAGPEPERYCEIRQQPSVTLHAYVSDVRPLYVESNVVIVPTRVSAGTNLKVLEAMAMERAVVSTASGCAGLGLEHGRTVLVAEEASQLAAHCAALLRDPAARRRLAEAAASHCRAHFGWRQLGRKQKQLWDELLGRRAVVRAGTEADLEAIAKIQAEAPGAALWRPADYLVYDLRLVEVNGEVTGFVVSRSAAGETEILNLAVAVKHRRQGLASLLLDSLPPARLLLEVRESNRAARELYRACGFIETGLRNGYYHDPEEVAILLEKPSH